MRFGAQAKKIENKVQANIITSANENDTIRLLIEDYEKKLKQLEKERVEDKEKIKVLTTDMNGKIRNGTDMKEFNKRILSDIDFLPKSGLIFLPKNSQRKEKIIRDYCERNLRKDWQGLIFDSEGKIALEAYKKIKDLQGLYLENQQQHEKNFKEIKGFYLDLQEKHLGLEQKKFDYKAKAKSLFQKLNLAQKELILLKNRQKLFESFHGLDKLKNQEILALEELYSKGLVECQNERLTRINKKTSHITNIEEEESPRRENRPLNNEEYEFSDNEGSKDSFEEMEEKIKKQENENKKLEEKFLRNIKKINMKINFKSEELKKFEQNYVDLILKKTNEERVNFVSTILNKNREKPKENKQKSKFLTKKLDISSDSSKIEENPKTNEKTKIHMGKLENYLEMAKNQENRENSIFETRKQENAKRPNLMVPQGRKQRFRSLDEREIQECKTTIERPKIIEKKPKFKGKNFIEINKKSLGFKVSLSKPLFETPRKLDSNSNSNATSNNVNTTNNNTNNTNNNNNPLGSKLQKALDRGNLFLENNKRNEKMEVKSAQMPPKTPVFENQRKRTGDQETLSNEEEKNKLLNNPKNTLMTLLSNLNNANTGISKKGEVIKEGAFFYKGNISKSCAFKISNYKSILDKETLKIIEEKKKKMMGNFDKGSEPNESGIEKILETDSFFSNCFNGFEYLLDVNEKTNSKGLDDIMFESDSGVIKNTKMVTEKNSGFKMKKMNK